MNPYYSDDFVTIYHGDCRELLPQLNHHDLVLTDPPYGIAYNREDNPQEKHAPSHRYQVASVYADGEPFDPGPLLHFRQLILWGANCYASRLPDRPTWLVWDKVVRNGLKLRIAECELAWTNCVKRPQVFRHMWSGGYRDSERGTAYHPTQKPVALMGWCLSLVPNTHAVLDPFMGSGPTLRAAKNLGLRATGIEIEERYCEIAAKRMGQEVLAL